MICILKEVFFDFWNSTFVGIDGRVIGFPWVFELRFFVFTSKVFVHVAFKVVFVEQVITERDWHFRIPLPVELSLVCVLG
jgi:hypothetical protein